MDRWNGRVAIVTGASAGIGRSIAEKLVENGLQVVGLARRQERLEQLEADLQGKKGKFFGHKTDISNKDDLLAAFKWVFDNVGPVSLLVNNAGINSPGSFIDGNFDGWKRVLDTNLYGLTISTSLALQNMTENNIDDGIIININSIAGHSIIALPNINVYPVSKFAVTAFTESVRKELALNKSKIRITSLSPGYVDTEIAEACGYDQNPTFQEFKKTAPVLAAVDIANAVLFIVGNPPHIQISELTIQPTGELL